MYMHINAVYKTKSFLCPTYSDLLEQYEHCHTAADVIRAQERWLEEETTSNHKELGKFLLMLGFNFTIQK